MEVAASHQDYQVSIGLEVHVQLRTRSKLFCACPVPRLGTPANSCVCPVCLGHPGTLPILSKAAVEQTVRLILGLGGEVQERSCFDRKSYFYPDLPKGFQITQADRPLGLGGEIEVPGWPLVTLERVHLEEDAGKLTHLPGGGTEVDFNRAGVPLAEIVTLPVLTSPRHARAFLEALKLLLEYLGVSDCNMAAGNLRCDANLSLARPGEALGTRTEVKNLNSFRNLESSLEFEALRQGQILVRGEVVCKETRSWDQSRRETRSLRSKESAADYRFFPEPDLPELVLSPVWLKELGADLPEFPGVRRARFQAAFELSDYDAGVLTATRERADYFEATLAATEVPAKQVCNWICSELLGQLGERSLAASGVPPEQLAALLELHRGGSLSGKQAKQVLTQMLLTGEGARAVQVRLGLEQLSEEEPLREWVAKVLEDHPEVVRSFREGKRRALGFLVGQVLKASGGAANPRRVNLILKEVLE
jgi:aspartyl-tRNA(Asn)/glutamyl-tRNA(Gln) amidotransferase subunit B